MTLLVKLASHGIKTSNFPLNVSNLIPTQPYEFSLPSSSRGSLPAQGAWEGPRRVGMAMSLMSTDSFVCFYFYWDAPEIEFLEGPLMFQAFSIVTKKTTHFFVRGWIASEVFVEQLAVARLTSQFLFELLDRYRCLRCWNMVLSGYYFWGLRIQFFISASNMWTSSLMKFGYLVPIMWLFQTKI